MSSPSQTGLLAWSFFMGNVKDLNPHVIQIQIAKEIKCQPGTLLLDSVAAMESPQLRLWLNVLYTTSFLLAVGFSQLVWCAHSSGGHSCLSYSWLPCWRCWSAKDSLSPSLGSPSASSTKQRKLYKAARNTRWWEKRIERSITWDPANQFFPPFIWYYTHPSMCFIDPWSEHPFFPTKKTNASTYSLVLFKGHNSFYLSGKKRSCTEQAISYCYSLLPPPVCPPTWLNTEESLSKQSTCIESTSPTTNEFIKTTRRNWHSVSLCSAHCRLYLQMVNRSSRRQLTALFFSVRMRQSLLWMPQWAVCTL